MKQFTLELRHDFSNYYRLQKDLINWRLLISDELMDGDYVTTEELDVILLQKKDRRVEIDGSVYVSENQELQEITDSPIHYKVTIHRNSFPNTPTIEQLKLTIESGSDEVSNALILNSDGLFELRERNALDTTIEDPTIIARSETFIAGNGYVGAGAANDDSFIESYYLDYLGAWVNHLSDGKADTYIDEYYPRESLDELLDQIEEHRVRFLA